MLYNGASTVVRIVDAELSGALTQLLRDLGEDWDKMLVSIGRSFTTVCLIDIKCIYYFLALLFLSFFSLFFGVLFFGVLFDIFLDLFIRGAVSSFKGLGLGLETPDMCLEAIGSLLCGSITILDLGSGSRIGLGVAAGLGLA